MSRPWDNQRQSGRHELQPEGGRREGRRAERGGERRTRGGRERGEEWRLNVKWVERVIFTDCSLSALCWAMVTGDCTASITIPLREGEREGDGCKKEKEKEKRVCFDG